MSTIMSIRSGKPSRKRGPGSPKEKFKGRKNQRHQVVLEYALEVWEALNTPVSLKLYMLAKAGEFEQIVRCDVQPSNYSDALDFLLDYQAVKLLSKNPFLDTGIRTDLEAYRKFVEFELLCKQTNNRFRVIEMTGHVPSRLSRILHAAQRKIQDILGAVPELDRLDFRFGPGAAFGVRGKTSVYHKVTSTLESTHSMVTLLPQFLGEFPGWFDTDVVSVNLVPGSDLTLVPKDAKTDRVICIEPLLNGLYQKGIGSYIRSKLQRHGIDLKDQSINQLLAGRAFAENLATVDFSSASDSISYGLVLNLLPPDWVELLDAGRCPEYRVDETWYGFNKFSSMGNAYTFELESLIFYALAYACSEESGIQPVTGVNLSVYGDDVIIPQGASDLFIEASEYCGFKVNTSKSFTSGSFFESCGHDYFTGTLVTPFRLKIDLRKPSELVYGANLILRIAHSVKTVGKAYPGPKVQGIVDRLLGVHLRFLQRIPRRYLVLGPWSEQDNWICAPFDYSVPRKGTFGWRHRTLIPVNVFEVFDWPSSYALYKAQDSKGGWDFMRDEVRAINAISDRVASDGVPDTKLIRYKVGMTWSLDWEFPFLIPPNWWDCDKCGR